MSGSGGARSSISGQQVIPLSAFIAPGNTRSTPVSAHMESQDSVKTEASSPDSPFGPSSTPPGTRPSSGMMPPADWGLPVGAPFPSTDNPKYTITAEIDDGGMGVVYEAHQRELGVVAIKVVKPRILGTAASERFLNEARAMAKVRTERGIATIFDCDWYTDTVTGTRAPFIAMEYVPGATPITSYAAERKLGGRARIELFNKVCEAVAAAHRAEIIHRDLKPSNVMITAAGQPKVIDFGLAVVRDPAEHARKLPSERGGLFGTLEYMSPEQASIRFDPHVLTAASDVYSLGVIMYELLTGSLPYAKHPGKSVQRFDDGSADYTEATRIIREDAPIPPHRVNRTIHPRIEAILLKALEKDPAKRYANAGELSAAIAAHLRFGRSRDVALNIPIVLLATLISGVISIPLFFNWLPAAATWQRTVTAIAPAVDELSRVMLITLDEQAGAADFPGVPAPTDPDGPPLGFGNGERMRPLLGALLEKLAHSQAAVVALDLYYTADSVKYPTDDDAMIAGAKAIDAAGIDWVMLTGEWQDRLKERPRAHQETPALLGAPWLDTPATDWRIHAALERNNQVLPAFSLITAAAYKHPRSTFVFSFDNVSFGVKLTAIDRTTGRQTQVRDPFGLSRVLPGDAPELTVLRDSSDTYEPTDRVGFLVLPDLPSDAAYAAATLPVRRLMSMTDEQLANACRGKVLLLANTHPDFTESEWSMSPDGRLLPHSFAHALAIECFLRDQSPIRAIDRYGEIGATLLAAALGALVARFWSGRWPAALGLGVGVALLLVALALLTAHLSAFIINPIVPVVALLVAVALGLCIRPVVRFVNRSPLSA